ncbi:hypothetical protein PTT_14955 [Pyrenophora teres f. teres 0-1]|uniref:Clr5 domain-containing protein n=1 Tax=Pyrenophora teres f. teres (strain 0-1) TaxID=861557 RepID=E3RZA2_PYRTT|nr:hypothetical protein PTT_14955 [Pyrenophora teres f. teres 0-1]
MPPQRTVAVGARLVPYRHSGLAPPSELTHQPAKPKQSRRTHSANEWESVREFIIKSYIDEDKTAEELVVILETEHNFVVGVRRLKGWMKMQGIVKNESKRNMEVLYAKRQHRLIFEGKQTIISKDGRVIDDARLDRWGNKFAADLNLINSVAAGKLNGAKLDDMLTKSPPLATPEHYSIATPRPTHLPDQFYPSGKEAFNALFVADKPVKMIFALVLDDVDVHESSSHRHHIGVLGL